MSFLTSKPDLAFEPDLISRRKLIAASALILLASFVSIAAQLAGWTHGLSMALFCMALSSYMVFFSPIRNVRGVDKLDERERALRDASFSTGAHVALALVVAGAFMMSVRIDNGDDWLPATQDDWRTIVFSLIAIWGSASMLSAALSSPYRTEAEEAEEF